MILSPDEELKLPDPFHWSRSFRGSLTVTELYERLRPHVDTKWSGWGFFAEPLRRPYYGRFTATRFILYAHQGLQNGASLR